MLWDLVQEDFLKFGAVKTIRKKSNEVELTYKTDEMADRAVKEMQTYKIKHFSVVSSLH